jgi:hypothetical protein
MVVVNIKECIIIIIIIIIIIWDCDIYSQGSAS